MDQFIAYKVIMYMVTFLVFECSCLKIIQSSDFNFEIDNYSIFLLFYRLFRDEQYNILSQLSKDEYREFRALVIDIVLATDMSHHFQQLKNIKSAMAIFAEDPSAEIDKTKALSLVVHMCDISHPAKVSGREFLDSSCYP